MQKVIFCFAVLCFSLVIVDYSLAQERVDHALRFDINAHGGGATSVAISSDDTLIASGGMDGKIRIWDILDGRQLYALGENGAVIEVVFSPDDRHVLCAVRSKDDKYLLQVWDYRKQKLRETIGDYDQRINSVAYSPEGSLIAFGSDDGTVRVLDVENGRSIREYETRRNEGVLAVSWSHDGSYLAGGVSWGGDVFLWDVSKDQSGKVLEGHSDWVNDVLYSPDGRTLISGGKDGSVRKWDVSTGKERSNIREWWWGEINALAIDESYTHLAGASSKGEIVVWYADDGLLLDVLNGHVGNVNDVTFSADGNTVVSGGSDGTVKIWTTPGTGTPELLFELAAEHDKGEGNFKENKKEAYKWYLRAAELGFPEAMVRLGQMLADGEGGDRNINASLAWLNKAAGLGNVDAEKKLNDLNDGLSFGLIDKNSLELAEKKAASGDVETQYRLGLIYRTGGHGISKSWTKAVKWFKKAAKKGHGEALFYTAESYETGNGSPKSMKNALKWYRKAAEQGHVKAYLRLGIFSCTGKGVEQNYAKAVELWAKASQGGDALATFFLAYMYETGSGLKRDMGQAKKFYAIAAGQGNVFADQAMSLLAKNQK